MSNITKALLTVAITVIALLGTYSVTAMITDHIRDNQHLVVATVNYIQCRDSDTMCRGTGNDNNGMAIAVRTSKYIPAGTEVYRVCWDGRRGEVCEPLWDTLPTGGVVSPE